MADSKADAINAPVVTQAKAAAGTIELPGAIFGEPLRRGLLHDVVRMQTAGRRAGTASTKERGDVRGLIEGPVRRNHKRPFHSHSLSVTSRGTR